ncbi:MAG TPA: DUF4238 domain-containing protein [Thermoanaerobaculia bacterium]|jgi:hypothetical protein
MPDDVIIRKPENEESLATPEPTSLERVLDALRKRCPGVDEKKAIALAHVWKHEIDSILRQMLDYSHKRAGFCLHVQLRDEITFDFTLLMLAVINMVVEHKLKLMSCEQLDPEAEIQAASSPKGCEKIRNTAKDLAEGIWIKKLERWQERTRRLLENQDAVRIRKSSEILLSRQRPSKVSTANHYVPSFTNRPWADSCGKVVVYSRKLDGHVKGVPRSYGSWGRASFLYSQALENQLSAIEGDAKRPWEKLLTGRPFSGSDERDWATFLIGQFFRTPRFILRSINHLKRMVDMKGWYYPNFPINPRNLRSVYETLFREDRVYASYYRSIARKSWWVVKPHPGEFFLKADEPILILGALRDKDSSLVLPLSPTRCFVAGPLFRKEKWPLRIGELQLKPSQAHDLSLQFAFNARETVISAPEHQSASLIADLAKVLANHPYNFRASLEDPKPFWGESPGRLLTDSRM